MTSVLDRDFAERMATRFGGRLYVCTFTTSTAGAFDPDNPTRAPAATIRNFKADGIAFGYQVSYVDGEQMWHGDYSVMLLLGTIVEVADDLSETPAPDSWPQLGATISIAAPNQATPQTARVTDISAITQASVTASVRGATP
jgi:hypothetical protein